MGGEIIPHCIQPLCPTTTPSAPKIDDRGVVLLKFLPQRANVRPDGEGLQEPWLTDPFDVWVGLWCHPGFWVLNNLDDYVLFSRIVLIIATTVLKHFCTEFVENPMKAGDEVITYSRANNVKDKDVCIKVCYFFYVKLFAHDLFICLLSIKVDFRCI